MIIGLTSLCLYNIIAFSFLQVGILYKVTKFILLESQNSIIINNSKLTIPVKIWYDESVGALRGHFLFFTIQGLQNQRLFGTIHVNIGKI